MPLKIAKERMLSEKISIDNSFILSYLPFAPESYVKIYLVGLYEALYGEGEDFQQTIAQRLELDGSVVMEAFRYWENQGVVSIIKSQPICIEFLSVGKSTPSMHKFSKTKYKDFNNQLNAAFPKRNILPSEYNEYYSFMEDSHMEPNAMLAIVWYCINQKGEIITYPYILAVARNLASQGLLTYDRVSEHLSELALYDKDISPILSALGTKRKPDHEDKRLFVKWTKSMGFTQATIVKVAKLLKKGGMDRLDAHLSRYYEHHLLSFEEIQAFNQQKEQLTELTKSINRIIGVYYEQLDFIIETYVSKWLSYGYDQQTLLTVATYCFKHNVRSLDGMDKTVDKFYKQGLVTAKSIEEFLSDAVEKDNFIQSVFEIIGLSRNITPRDRDSFKMWLQGWGISSDLIRLAAQKSAGKPNAIAYMNGILSNWYKSGVTSVEQAESLPLPSYSADNSQNTVTKTYTTEQINALFANLDEEDI